MSDAFKGYKGRALSVLKKFNVRVWSDTKIQSTRGDFEGIILPRSENDDDKHLVLKLATGYNVGIDVNCDYVRFSICNIVNTWFCTGIVCSPI